MRRRVNYVFARQYIVTGMSFLLTLLCFFTPLGEIDSNDKNLIPILTKASTRELELENLHEDREEEKHDDEQESEYVVSDKGKKVLNFPNPYKKTII